MHDTSKTITPGNERQEENKNATVTGSEQHTLAHKLLPSETPSDDLLIQIVDNSCIGQQE